MTKTVAALVKSTFYALADGHVAGERVKAGQPVELTAREAQYEPVTSVAPKAETPRKPRRKAPAKSGTATKKAPAKKVPAKKVPAKKVPAKKAAAPKEAPANGGAATAEGDAAK